MLNNNTMSSGEYILNNVFWGIGVACLYRMFIFTPLPNCSKTHSEVVLYAALIIMASIGVGVTITRRRNYISIIGNVAIPIGLYAFFSYSTAVPLLTVVPLAIGIAGALSYIVAVFCYAKNTTIDVAKRLAHGLLGGRTILALCFAALVVALYCANIFGFHLRSTDVTETYSKSEGPWTIAENVEVLSKLQEDNWAELSIQDRLDVLGIVVNIEAQHFGLVYHLTLGSSYLPESTLAQYSRDTHKVTVNMVALEKQTARDMLISICHECYHSYQEQLIELYYNTPKKYRNMPIFSPVPYYLEELSNYESGEDDIIKYYYQVSEMTARTYAEQSADEYYRMIDLYRS